MEDKEKSQNNPSVASTKPPITSKPWLSSSADGSPSKTNTQSAHYQAACKNLSPIGKRAFSLIEFDDNENLVAEIRKHWFGLVLIWLVGLLVTIILAGMPLLMLGDQSLVSAFAGDGVATGNFNVAIILISIILGGLAFLVTALLALFYTRNVMFVTTQKLAQVKYAGLIHRKVSQLSIGDVQDSTVKQSTIPARIFNYGKMTMETAGEQDNFEFSYVPNPAQNARAIIWAHEENMKLYGN